MRSFTFVTCLVLVSAAQAQVLTSSQMFDGNGSNIASAIATDPQGNVFVAGTTTSSDFPLVNPLYARLPEPALRMSGDGHTFTPSTLVPAAVTAMAASADGRTVLAGTPAGIYRSADAGATWSAAPFAISGREIALAIDPANPANAYAVVSTPTAALLYRSSDGGVTWQTTGNPVGPASPSQSQIVIDPRNPATILALFANAIYRSDDAGLTWNLVTTSHATLSALAIAPSQPQTWYAVTSDAFLIKSTDAGVTWQTLPVLAGSLALNTLAVDPHDPNNLYYTNGTDLAHSTDGGQTAQTAFQDTSGEVVSIAFDPRDSTHVFATDTTRVYASFDNGATWTTAISGQFNAVLASPSGIYAAGAVTPTLFLAKLDATLSHILFSTLIGPARAASLKIAVDAKGNPLVTGIATTADFPVTATALQPTLSSANPGFAVKVRADGSALLLSTLLNGIQPGEAAFDSAGNLVIAGGAQGTEPVTSAAYQATIPSGCRRPAVAISLVPGSDPNHAFVLKLNPDASAVLWATYVTGACGDTARALRLDSTGNVIFTGSTNSDDFPVTQNAMTPKFPGGTNSGFLAELSPDGAKLLYSTYFGDGDFNGGNALALDARGSAYVGGFTHQKASPGALSVQNSLECPPMIYIGPAVDQSEIWNDGFVMKLALDGTLPSFFATIGGGCQDSVSSLSLDGAGNIWVSGGTQSQDFPTVAPIGVLGPANGGYIAELDPTASKLLFATLTGPGAVTADGHAGAYLATQSLAAHIDGGQPLSVALDAIAPPGQQQPLIGPSVTVPTVAPGQLLLLNGRGIGPAIPVNPPLTAGGTFPTTAAEVQVLFDGIPVPLATVGANQIECQAPFELDGKTVTSIQVVYNGRSANVYTVGVAPQNISILAILNEDFTLNTPANPAAGGSIATLFVTGLGQTVPAGIDGAVNTTAATQPRTLPILNLFGPTPATLFLGAAPGQSNAVFQINFTVPSIPNPQLYYSVALSAGNYINQASTKLYVK